MAEGAASAWVDLYEYPNERERELQRRRQRSPRLQALEIEARLAEVRASRRRFVELQAYAFAELPSELSSFYWVTELDLSSTHVSDLTPLAGLTNVTALNLGDTGVRDLTPLAGLTNLRQLDLDATDVSDLAPLAGLTNLTWLNLNGPDVSDLKPLSKLANLTGLVLNGTLVHDLTPLAALTRPIQLVLSHTRVSDLTPLMGLTKLEHLDLDATGVRDLTPLAGLTNLTRLNLDGTGVRDLSPLLGLANLTRLVVSNTAPSDLTPLAGLTSLIQLDLDAANVRDLTPLAGLANLAELNLDGTDVHDLAPLAGLARLTRLVLSNTATNDLTPLAGLMTLIQLDLDAANVRDLTPLASLANLTRLFLGGTGVGDLTPLAGLTNLTMLDLDATDVSDLTPLAGLTNLTMLDLDATDVSDLMPLSGLTNLTKLFLGGTGVSDLTPLVRLTNLTKLDLGGTRVLDANQLERLLLASPGLSDLDAPPCEGVPAELFEGQCSTKLRDYFAAVGALAAPSRELKVVLVGNAYVGKTTLADRLMGREPSARDPSDRTHGIVTETFLLHLGSAETMSIHLWDFGGQALYHATHRCFLHQGPLYLLLWCESDDATPNEGYPELEAKEPIPYWLHWIKHLAPHSPIVLIKNKVDQSNSRLLPNGVSGHANPFADQCNISAKLGTGVTERLLPVLRDQVENLRHRWGYLVPRTWLAVREELGRLRTAGAMSISRGHFDRLCQQCKVDAASTLLEYLHEAGFLYCLSSFPSDLVVLDQNWLIQAVYTLLDPRLLLDADNRQRTSSRERIKKQRGEFSGTDVRDFWGDHDDADCKTFLAFMKQVAIVFEVSQATSEALEERCFVLPDLLPTASDRSVRAVLAGWPPPGACAIELEYGFLPRSVLHQLMALLHPRSRGFDAWATGFIYSDVHNGDRLRIEFCPYTDGRADLCIELASSQPNISGQPRVEALRRLLGELSSVQGPRYDRLWVTPDATQPTGRVELSSLQRHGDHVTTRDGVVVAAKNYRFFRDLLDEGRHNDRDGHAADVSPVSSRSRPIHLFISYAHADEDPYLKRFEVVLKGLQRTYSMLEWWHDRRLIAGTAWEKAPPDRREQGILDKLNPADIVCLLVSPEFIASDYIHAKELPLALQRYHTGGGYAVPIILRPTPGWQCQFGAIQALPRDAKWSCPDLADRFDCLNQLGALVSNSMGDT